MCFFCFSTYKVPRAISSWQNTFLRELGYHPYWKFFLKVLGEKHQGNWEAEMLGVFLDLTITHEESCETVK